MQFLLLLHALSRTAKKKPAPPHARSTRPHPCPVRPSLRGEPAWVPGAAQHCPPPRPAHGYGILAPGAGSGDAQPTPHPNPSSPLHTSTPPHPAPETSLHPKPPGAARNRQALRLRRLAVVANAFACEQQAFVENTEQPMIGDRGAPRPHVCRRPNPLRCRPHRRSPRPFRALRGAGAASASARAQRAAARPRERSWRRPS